MGKGRHSQPHKCTPAVARSELHEGFQARAHKAGCAALTGAHSGAPLGSVPWNVAHLCATPPTSALAWKASVCHTLEYTKDPLLAHARCILAWNLTQGLVAHCTCAIVHGLHWLSSGLGLTQVTPSVSMHIPLV